MKIEETYRSRNDEYDGNKIMRQKRNTDFIYAFQVFSLNELNMFALRNDKHVFKSYLKAFKSALAFLKALSLLRFLHIWVIR